MKPVVAAFDFDKTLTSQDTYVPFLIFCCGWKAVLRAFFFEIIFVIGFLLRVYSRQKAKEKILTRLFKGKHYDWLKQKGIAFVQGPLKTYLNEKGMKAFYHHRRQGHRCVLISASLDVYLEAWGKEAGFDDILCSQLEVSNDGTLTGKLLGTNCRGSEKVRRLEILMGNRENYHLIAYGDSAGDRELLAYADEPHYRAFH